MLWWEGNLAVEAALTYKRKEARFAVQDVSKMEEFGYVLEREYAFITEKELVDKYKLESKQLPFKWLELREGSEVLRGVVVQSPTQPHRIVRVRSGLSSMMVEKVHDATRQLRAKQAAEVVECQREGIQKQLRLADSVPTLAVLDEKVQEAKQALQAAQTEQELRKALAPMEDLAKEEPTPSGVLGAPLLAFDEDDEEREQDEDKKRAIFMDPGISSALADKRRRLVPSVKAKPKAKAKSQCQVSKRGRSSLGSDAGSVVTADEDASLLARKRFKSTGENGSVASEHGGGTSMRRLPKEDQTYGQSAATWMDKVDFVSLMGGS